MRNFLIDGMKNWNVWSTPSTDIRYELAETFLNSLWRAKSYKTFRFGKKTKDSLKNWINHSLKVLNIEDDPAIILDKFVSNGFIERYYRKKKQ